MLAPKGKPFYIILLFSILSSLVNFQEAYSNSYPNTSYFSFRNYINESYITRGVSNGVPEWIFTWIWSLILNIWFIGFLFGVFFTPYLTDNYGRKYSLIVGNIVSLIATIICTIGIAIKLPELFFFGRIVASASCGVSFITLILFLQETTPTNMRGICSFLSETSFIAMNVVGISFGLNSMFGRNLTILVGFAIIPGILAILIMFPLKETPKFLLLHKKDKQAAIESLIFYRGNLKDFDDVIVNILKESDEKMNLPILRGILNILIQPHLRKALILGIASLQLVVGIWPILYLSTDILETHFSNEMAQYCTFAFIICDLIASILGTFYVDKYGRRPMMICFGILNTLCLILYIIFDNLSLYISNNYRYGCVISLILFGITYGAALGPIAYFITSELSAQRYRSLLQSIVFGTNTIINFIFSFVTLPMYQWISSWSFLPLFIIPSIISLLYLYYNLPETKGKEIHEIVSQMINNENKFYKRNNKTSETKILESTSSNSDNDYDNIDNNQNNLISKKSFQLSILSTINGLPQSSFNINV